MINPTLFVFSGLPGVGKTTIAQSLARQVAAVYVRIDTIEQALRSSEMLRSEVGPAGYLIAYRIAVDNLRLGLSVTADCVNPLEITRNAWRMAAFNASARVLEIEVICSDPVEHRGRVETRTSDIDALGLPTWKEVCEREYDAWKQPRIIIDTAHKSIDKATSELMAQLGVAVAHV